MTYRQAPTHWLKFYDEAVIETEARTAVVQILVTLTAVIKPLLPYFLGRTVVILNFTRRLGNFIIRHSALVEK